MHWFFLCFGFLETWEKSWPSGPEIEDCELASESICTLCADIFKSRYLSSANSNWNLWQKMGWLEDKGRNQVFSRCFRAILEFLVLEWVASPKKLWDFGRALNLFYSINVLIRKIILRVIQHCIASLITRLWCPKIWDLADENFKSERWKPSMFWNGKIRNFCKLQKAVKRFCYAYRISKEEMQHFQRRNSTFLKKMSNISEGKRQHSWGNATLLRKCSISISTAKMVKTLQVFESVIARSMSRRQMET